jgi:hypothetical protein
MQAGASHFRSPYFLYCGASSVVSCRGSVFGYAIPWFVWWLFLFISGALSHRWCAVALMFFSFLVVLLWLVLDSFR